MITITLTNVLKLKGKIPSSLKVFILREYRYPNPTFTSYIKRMKKFPPWIPEFIVAFKKKGNTIILPRGSYDNLKKFLESRHIQYVVIDKRSNKKRKRQLLSTISTWEHQESNVRIAIRKEQGTIVIPAGGGKTETAIEIISRLQQPTIILVHRVELITQWVKRIEKTLRITPGIIQGKRFEVKPITIASIPTLTRRELPDDFYKLFGCVILEEAHHCPASSFEDVIQRFHAKYRFGITADTKRSDNLERFLFAVCGNPIKITDNEELYENELIIRPTIQPIISTLRIPVSDREDWHKVASRVSNDQKRNKIISKIALRDAQDGHKVLILSDRKAHLRNMYAYIQEKGNSAIVTADLGHEKVSHIIDQFSRGKINILLSTQLADEGLDIPSLDRVILSFPGKSRTKIIQRCGRIQRIFPGKSDPIIYDIVDRNVSLLERQYDKRRTIYRSLGYKMRKII